MSRNKTIKDWKHKKVTAGTIKAESIFPKMQQKPKKESWEELDEKLQYYRMKVLMVKEGKVGRDHEFEAEKELINFIKNAIKKERTQIIKEVKKLAGDIYDNSDWNTGRQALYDELINNLKQT